MDARPGRACHIAVSRSGTCRSRRPGRWPPTSGCGPRRNPIHKRSASSGTANLDAYLSENVSAASRPGEIVDTAGQVVGQHRGIARYTVGQRKGLGISVGEPVFVTSIDAATDRIVVGDRAALGVSGLALEETSFVGPPPTEAIDVAIQYRAHGDVARGSLAPGDNEWAVTFPAAVEAVAPGQSAAIYSAEDPDELLGGGIIAATKPVAVAV